MSIVLDKKDVIILPNGLVYYTLNGNVWIDDPNDESRTLLMGSDPRLTWYRYALDLTQKINKQAAELATWRLKNFASLNR